MYLVHITIIPILLASVFQCIIPNSVYNAVVSPAFHSAWFWSWAQPGAHNYKCPQAIVIATNSSSHFSATTETIILAINRLDQKESWTVISITYKRRRSAFFVLATSFQLPVNLLWQYFVALYTWTIVFLQFQFFFHTKSNLNVLGRWGNLNNTRARRSPY